MFQRQNMKFLVVATDNGHPPRNNQARVVIDVADAHQVKPTWQNTPKCPNQTSVYEDAQVMFLFLKITAKFQTTISNKICEDYFQSISSFKCLITFHFTL